ncbi:MAG TPA: hypothetical protein VL832_04025 [Puia sp.]|nr:hypothetical protein [Puia sp.]
MSKLAYLFVAVGIFIIALLVWQFYKYRLVHDNVNKAVSEKSKGLYRIQYDNLLIDEVGGSLHVKNIRIEPDTSVYNQLVVEKKDPPTLIRLTIPALDITGVKTPKALLTKQIEGGKVVVTNPTIEIMLNHFKKDSTVYNPARDLSKQLLGKLLKISIDSVEMVHANVLVRNLDAKEALFKGDDISCKLSDLLIDSVANKDPFRILFSRELDIACDRLILPSKNKKYKLNIGDLRFMSRNNSLSIGQVKLIPQLSEAEFAASFPIQKDRYDFSLEGISLLHIDREGLWHKKIQADSLVIRKSSFKIYRDLSRPKDTTSKVGKYPQQQLVRLPIPISIKKMIFSHSFIEYKEKNGKSDSAGKVQFFDANATIVNVTNRKEVISRNNRCILSFRAKFLDKTPVDATIVMLLKDPQGKFLIEGNLGPIDARSLNGLTQPMGLARLEKGNIDHLHFAFSGTDSSSNGRLIMLYKDLKITLLKKDKKENKYDKKGLASLAANLIMKNSNPEGDKDPRVADVRFNRILNKSFFNLIWKTIFTGVKETAGIK